MDNGIGMEEEFISERFLTYASHILIKYILNIIKDPNKSKGCDTEYDPNSLSNFGLQYSSILQSSLITNLIIRYRS